MNLTPSHSTSARTGESGTVIVILLIFISLFSVITLGASHSLARLRTEVLALEQRHAARTSPSATKTSTSVDTPATNPSVPAAKPPAPLKPDEPAR